ncbi:hypothetical protein K474DRAFT_1776262 [Panus rudis PR-1116 ss-1]|nr:hypothetical protein K474DRAFT_1776262 [Panus rudis PR-1116 ss-1]
MEPEGIVESMDQDSAAALSLFDTSPEKFPFRSPRPQEIENRRALMSDVLLFDIVLRSGGIRHPQGLYPPHDVPSLNTLLLAIETSQYDTMKRDSIICYLLKWHQDGREVAFMHQKCIQPQFAALSDAYWFLDTGVEIPRAISLLTDARLNRDNASKILEAIALTDSPYPLIRKYIQTAKPLLLGPADLNAYTVALLDSSLLEAWQYQGTFPETSDTRKRLLRIIFHWCFSPKPKPKPLTQLLAYPLSQFEQNLLHDYALHPPADFPSHSIPALQNLVCTRLIESGQYAAAIKLDRQFSVKSAMGESFIRQAAQDRRKLMDEILTVMPAVERMLLEQELEDSGYGREMPPPPAPTNAPVAASSSSANGWYNNTPDLSMSWEYVRPPPAESASAGPSTRAKGRASDAFTNPAVLPIPQRSGAPRFGGPPPPEPSEPEPILSISAGRPFPSNRAHPSTVSSTRNPISSAVPNANAVSTTPTSGKVKAMASLFDQVGSANMTRNAFYDPPVSAGAKRPLAQDGIASARSNRLSASVGGRAGIADLSSASASDVRDILQDEDEGMEDEEDVAMDEDRQEEPAEVKKNATSDVAPEVAIEEDRKKHNGTTAGNGDVNADEPASELTYSLFSSNAPPNISGKRRLARTETERMMPPGAFFPDDEPEPDSPISPTPARTSTRQSSRLPKPEITIPTAKPRQSRGKRTASPPTSEAPQTRTRGTTATPAKRKSARIEKTPRKLPGALMDDDDDDDDDEEEDGEPQSKGNKRTEEDDVIAPLPASTSTGTRRQPRKSRASTTKAADDEKPRATRRSTRLSTVGSRAGSDSEGEVPASPVKRRSRASINPTPKKTRKRQ